MHLAGHSDAADIIAARASFLEHASDRLDRGVRPIFRPLLRPQRLLHSHVFMRSGDRRDFSAARVDQQSARSARANVDSHPIHSFWQTTINLMVETVLEAVVAEVLASTQVIDIHTHLFAPGFGSLGLWGIDHLLTYHYLEAELFRSAPIRPEEYWALTLRSVPT